MLTHGRWLQLTCPDGSPVWINSDAVTRLQKRAPVGSIITFAHKDDTQAVSEDPDRILKLIG